MDMPNSGSNHPECDASKRGNFGVAILAAGSSSRMGRPKLLLPWGKTTILGHLIDRWRELEAKQIGVVCAAGETAVTHELDRLAFPTANRIVNSQPELGMFSSIQCAARWPGWEPGLEHWVLALGDQPQLRRKTLRALLSWANNHPHRICLPAYQGRPRHPVVIPKADLQALADSQAGTLKAFIEGREASWCPLDDPLLAMDIDTPEAYQHALRHGFPTA